MLLGLIADRIVPHAPTGIGIGLYGPIRSDDRNGIDRVIIPAGKHTENPTIGCYGHPNNLRFAKLGYNLKQ